MFDELLPPVPVIPLILGEQEAWETILPVPPNLEFVLTSSPYITPDNAADRPWIGGYMDNEGNVQFELGWASGTGNKNYWFHDFWMHPLIRGCVLALQQHGLFLNVRDEENLFAEHGFLLNRTDRKIYVMNRRDIKLFLQGVYPRESLVIEGEAVSQSLHQTAVINAFSAWYSGFLAQSTPTTLRADLIAQECHQWLDALAEQCSDYSIGDG